MSRTLFLYIFKDLLRIFLLTAGALAGIMSFGGLLRPLTEHGLDAGQVGRVLTYFMPAMTTYSLPIAALFATTMVYGRLAADNELTACRAAGISFLSISMPAVVLGLLVAITSLLFLCFIVPAASLNVERVIYSNLAQLVATEIDRTRQIRFEDQTIYAERAVVAPPSRDRPTEQVVTLQGVMVTTYTRPNPRDPRLQVPSDFYLARAATIFINRGGSNDDEYSVDITLDGGNMFPREFTRPFQGGVSETHIGPILRPSPINEETKFMDIRKLHALLGHESRSRRVQQVLKDLIRAEQSAVYLEDVLSAMNRPNGFYRFDAGSEVFEIRRTEDRPIKLTRGELIVPSARLTQEHNGDVLLTADAQELTMTVLPTAQQRLAVHLRLHGAKVQMGEEVSSRGEGFSRDFTVAMPPEVRAIASRQPADYLRDPGVSQDDRNLLRRALVQLRNGIYSELNARASFALSCLFLVIVGCVLGMMFRSGNFLTAFAVSVIPALLCIALIVTGQHTAENIARDMRNFHNPLNLGLALIWGGNIAVLILGVVLMMRLQRE